MESTISKPRDIKFKVIELPRVEKPYPPKDEFMAESPEIMSMWDIHLKMNPKVDDRHDRRPTLALDPKKLAYVVEKGENIIVIDERDKSIALVVVQGMIADEDVVKNFRGLISEHLKHGLPMRREDPGTMVAVGYTGGQLSEREVTWAANLNRSKLGGNTDHGYAMSCMFAHVWNIALQYLPKPIIEDYDYAAKRQQGLRMDAGATAKGLTVGPLQYTLKSGGEMKSYTVSELAPASGSVAQNYCRYTHDERNANDYCVSWTAHRSHPPEEGGNFYSASYRVLAPGRSDQLVAWRGLDHHGTTLSNVEPLDKTPTFIQSGIAFILPSTIAVAQEVTRNKKKEQSEVTEVQKEALEDNLASGLPQTLDYENTPGFNRASMPVTKKKDRTGKPPKVYNKDRIAEYTFPEIHAYSDSKAWTKACLTAEIRKRNKAGGDLEDHHWEKKDALIYELLKDDGVDVSVTYYEPPPEKSPKKRKRADTYEEIDEDIEALEGGEVEED